ncbi:isochorismate synthase [Yersinia entomophaga]|uniref:isochorismate synthase n=1 Tax=Yersinia entomophaga TaxID=935293 RepID=A0ABN4PSP8_YERET|nr:isochorismate synthase [Yersinia entomophaga]ANI30092.1 isochorismate synthase [Yersinia entomophaga]OWF87617.1 isochorismate synthase [Yersinia entomophaga]
MIVIIINITIYIVVEVFVAHSGTAGRLDNSLFSATSSAFLFTSAHRSIKTQGVAERITQRAQGGAEYPGTLQESIQKAFIKARADGLQRPIVVGAIPFDISQPTQLFIPQSYQFLDRQELVSAASDTSEDPVSVAQWRSLPNEDDFKQAVAQAVETFRRGAMHKVVLSRILEIETETPINPNRVINHLLRQNPGAFHFHIPLSEGGVLLGASPELLVRKDGDRVYTNPLAGSAKRQATVEGDHVVSQALMNSGKDQYEHRLVIDEIRRLLTPYCRSLNIPTQPSLISTAALWHLSTAISGELESAQTSVLELACLLHPTPALCGFPTESARRLINQLEPFERGLFSGIVGWCDEDGNGEWAVAIRCATLHDTQARLFAGAGIVMASQPALEWAETEAKLGTMLNALGIQSQGRLP